MKTYAIKEMFRTIQGEGANVGRVAVFIRFAGCNLWTGKEEDRTSAVCRFCDTQFVGTDGVNGGRYFAAALAAKAKEVWGQGKGRRFAVLTGGEPMLQVDPLLLDALHRFDFDVAIETNGTRPVPLAADWITVSPKAGAGLLQRIGQELKVVFPQDGLDLDALAELPFRHHWLQPMDGPNLQENTVAILDYIALNPRWRLSIQTHKILGIP